MNELRFSTEDLSKMFGVGKSTIKRWTDAGKLQCYKTPGGHRKFKATNIEEFIKTYNFDVSLSGFSEMIQNSFSDKQVYTRSTEEHTMVAA